MAQRTHSIIMLDVNNRLTLTCLLLLLPFGACDPANTRDEGVVEATQSGREALPSPQADAIEPPAPIISVVVARGANAFDNPGGVTFAVWSDGRVMRSAFPERVTNWIVQGRLSTGQIEQIRQATAMLRDHKEPKGHFCCSHMSVKVLDGAAAGIYTHQLANGRKSQPIVDFVDVLWKLQISDGVRVSGAANGRFPNSGLKEIYPDL